MRFYWELRLLTAGRWPLLAVEKVAPDGRDGHKSIACRLRGGPLIINASFPLLGIELKTAFFIIEQPRPTMR
jgi:hypothetical protein